MHSNMYSNFSDGDPSAALALLSHLTDDELKELLNDDDKFEEMMKDHKQIKDLDTEKEMLLVSNRSLAEFNLSREQALTEGKCRLQQLSEEGESLVRNIEARVAELKEKSSSTNAETILALLQTAAAEIEEESEGIAEKFLEGEEDVDSFLDQFQTRRKLMHLRRVKADKMADLLLSHNQNSNSQNTNSLVSSGAPYPSYPSGNNSYYPPPPPVGGAPYPTGMFNMPLPGSYPVPRY